MFVSVDWASFTLEMKPDAELMRHALWGRVGDALAFQYPFANDVLVEGHDFKPRTGRAPYHSAQQREDNGVMLFASVGLPHALVEVGGIGCDALGGVDAEIALLREVRATLTRVDIAVDIYTQVMPDEFCQQRVKGRFKAWSETLSSTGHTVYVGSKSSDRYARVYRYFDPHPRAAFLRVEHVLRGEQARLAVDAISENGIEFFASALGNTFGWQHEVWSPAENTDDAVKAWRPERRSGKTVSWVYTQVLPALLKLHREGVMDVRELFQTEILEKLDREG